MAHRSLTIHGISAVFWLVIGVLATVGLLLAGVDRAYMADTLRLAGVGALCFGGSLLLTPLDRDLAPVGASLADGRQTLRALVRQSAGRYAVALVH